jgi:signal transduction histidine kinase
MIAKGDQVSESKAKILMIDDDEYYCHSISDLLSLGGQAVEYVHSVDDGLKYLHINPDTDILLLDIDLGTEINGLQALPTIHKEFPFLQIIMITVHTSLEFGLSCMKAGAFDYLTKPFQAESLLKIIPPALERKRLSLMNLLYFDILIHDLKNPLQNMMFALDFCHNHLDRDSRAQGGDFKAIADFGHWQVQNIIANILDIHRFENSLYKVRLERFDIGREIEERVAPVSRQVALTEKRLSVECRLAEAFLFETDRHLLGHILNNALWNAVRFTQAGDMITVSCHGNSGGGICLDISNTGSFIEENNREAVFNKFFQVRDVSENKGRNYGLGLTFCKLAVDLLGGRIWIDGKKEIPETTLRMVFPMMPQ